MPAYPNALIQATPRNALLGRLSDALAYTYSPERTQQAQQLAQFLSVPAISRTLDKLSYGEPLTTGAGGLGGTTRFNNDALEAAMTIAPMVGPAAKVAGKGAMATGRFVAPKAGQLAEQYMVKTGGILPLDVYHGTPHTLPPTARNPLGEFDASKIGTGEGAQAYGHGIYTAEAPAVARGYADRLGANYISVDGKPMDFNNPVHIAASIISDPNNAGLPGKQLASAIRYNPKGIVPFGAESKVEEIAKALESGNLPKFTNQKGNFYKIDLPDEKIAKMLDWDKPLNQQSAEIQALAKQFDYPLERSGGDFQRWASSPSGALRINLRGPKDAVGIEAQAANFFKASGIPGIKYLDEGSRNLANTWIVKHPQGGENVFSTKELAEAFLRKYPKDKSKLIEPKVTRNFVTFPGEEKSMTILERNGQKFDNSALMK